jgi:hypothetical protein
MVKVVSPVSQREVEAVPVDFEAKAEPWSTISLDDGSTVKIRTVVTAVTRLEGEHDQQGNPVYVVSHNTLIRVVSAPKTLRGPPTVSPGMSGATPSAGPEVR